MPPFLPSYHYRPRLCEVCRKHLAKMGSNPSDRRKRLLDSENVAQLFSENAVAPTSVVQAHTRRARLQPIPEPLHSQSYGGTSRSTVQKRILSFEDDHQVKKRREFTSVTEPSPWNKYTQTYQLKFDGFVVVAVSQGRGH